MLMFCPIGSIVSCSTWIIWLILGCGNVNARYLMAFLTEKGNLASAYKLLGQILEKQQQSALDAYKRSLDLDSSQKDILLKGIVYTNC